MLRYAKNYLKNYAALKLFGDRAVRYPMVVSFYVTHRCNLRCTYCSDGNGIPFYAHKRKELTLEQIQNLFRRIKPATNILDITGGEPLMRWDILEIINSARLAGFKKLFLNTNGLLLDRTPEIIDAVDVLCVSLDSLHKDTLMNMYKTDMQSIEHIIANIQSLSKSKTPSKVLLSTVLAPDNLTHISALLDFCRKNGFGFAASPALQGKVANVRLYSSKEYQQCIDEILVYKNQGLPVVGSQEYFHIIRNFSKYTCYPMLMPVIDPEGKVYFPCLEIAERMVDLFEFQDLKQLISSVFNGNQSMAPCGNGCHILCHAGLSTALANPMSSIREVYSEIKNRKRFKTVEVSRPH